MDPLSIVNVCRACLRQDGEFQPIFSNYEESISFADIINTYISSSFQIDLNDGLTDVICTECTRKVVEFHQFKLNIENNQQILKSHISDNKVLVDKNEEKLNHDVFFVKPNIFKNSFTKDNVIETKSFEDNYENNLSIKQEELHYEDMIIDNEEKKYQVLSTDDMDKEESLEKNDNLDILIKKDPDDNYQKFDKNALCNEERICDIENDDNDSTDDESNQAHMLPEHSKKRYKFVYDTFMEWKKNKKIGSFSENVLLDYFEERSQRYKSSSLWAQYSMLKSTLKLNHNIKLQNYPRLVAFLKKKSNGYKPKKTKMFSSDEIAKFINEAPDITYLSVKVALILGICGTCSGKELYSLNIEDLEDLGSTLVVTICNKINENVKKFLITGPFYNVVKKYIDLRPANISCNAFFLNYRSGKCTFQKIGINKLGSMGKLVAKFLMLPNPELYTGRCFRQSSFISSLEKDKEPSLNNMSLKFIPIKPAVKKSS